MEAVGLGDSSQVQPPADTRKTTKIFPRAADANVLIATETEEKQGREGSISRKT